MFIFLGWLIGLAAGAVAITAFLLALGVTVPVFLTTLASTLMPLIAALPAGLAILLAVLFLVACFLVAYGIATASIAPLLPAATGLPVVTFPAAAKFTTSGLVPATMPATSGEFFGRGMQIGLSASINAVLLILVPGAGVFLAPWAFTVISLAAVVFVARNRFYQGFLGWSGWLFPLSYLATSVGLLLFLVNLPFALGSTGPGAIAIDWTTGVIETRGVMLTTFNGGFSLGNFIFLAGTAVGGVGPAPARFVSPSLSSHETGHSLNTAAAGGIVLWINAIDENIAPRRMNLAYGELTAEGHARNMPGAPMPDFDLTTSHAVRHWL